jgi:hypothetical protein
MMSRLSKRKTKELHKAGTDREEMKECSKKGRGALPRKVEECSDSDDDFDIDKIIPDSISSSDDEDEDFEDVNRVAQKHLVQPSSNGKPSVQPPKRFRTSSKFKLTTLNSQPSIRYDVVYKNLLRDFRRYFYNDFN